MTPSDIIKLIEEQANDVGANASTSPRDKFDIAKISYKAGAEFMYSHLKGEIDALNYNYKNLHTSWSILIDKNKNLTSALAAAKQAMLELKYTVARSGRLEKTPFECPIEMILKALERIAEIEKGGV